METTTHTTTSTRFGRCVICETTVWAETRGEGTRTRPGGPNSAGHWMHDDCREDSTFADAADLIADIQFANPRGR